MCYQCYKLLSLIQDGYPDWYLLQSGDFDSITVFCPNCQSSQSFDMQTDSTMKCLRCGNVYPSWLINGTSMGILQVTA